MEALKLPRSSLTETMRSLSASQGPRSSEPRAPPHRLPDDVRPSPSAFDYYTKMPSKGDLPQRWQWRSPAIMPVPTAGLAGKEIQAILAPGASQAAQLAGSNHPTSPIFGCSPPRRAMNPLSQDSKFKTPPRHIGGLSAAFAPSES